MASEKLPAIFDANVSPPTKIDRLRFCLSAMVLIVCRMRVTARVSPRARP